MLHSKMKSLKVNIFGIVAICFLFFIFNCSSGGSDDGPTTTIDNTPPSAPANLQYSQTTENSTTLSWSASTDNVGVKNYTIYQDNSSIGTSTNLSYSVNGLTPSTTYEFKIKASDDANNLSNFSNAINVTTNASNQLQLASGNIENYIGNIIDNAPSSSGDDYSAPSDSQLEICNAIINAVLDDDLDEAVLKSGEIGYQITEFTDTSITPNELFYVIEKRVNRLTFGEHLCLAKHPSEII